MLEGLGSWGWFGDGVEDGWGGEYVRVQVRGIEER